jgi:nicotinate-nucleotide--dimethylbenzimidazole phosphoribosyltransferase
MRLLTETINKIEPINTLMMERAEKRWDSIAKPLHSLGLLEDSITRIAGITGNDHVFLDRCSLFIACADNGIVEEHVTQTGSEVTLAVAENFVRRKTSVCIMAKQADIDIFPFDFGMLSEVDGIPACKLSRGTKNFARQPAMEYEDARTAVENGITAAGLVLDHGCQLLCLGEMGIGNTTTSSAVVSSLLQIPAKEVTGRGSGLSAEGILHKIEVIELAQKKHRPDPSDAIDVLSKVGGFDLAALCGAILACASRHIPVLLDGFISSAAALLAVRLCPEASGYLLASHVSKEPAGALLLSELGLKPLLTCEMCLGEGTGAVAAVPILRMAQKVYESASIFEDIQVEQYQPL